MTDNEIIKALEKCRHLLVTFHPKLVGRDVLDLINRKNDLIHRQSDVISEQKEKLERIYSEAIKEFADLSSKRICENVTPIPQQKYLVNMCIQEIENTKKEMVG